VAARSALEHAQQRAAGADAAAAALTAHDDAAERKRGEHARLSEALAREEARIATLERELDADETRLTAALGDAADAAALIAGLEQRAQRLDRAAEAVERARAQVAEAGRARAAADDEAQVRGFADAQAAHGAAREDGEIAALEQQLREHDDRVAECRAALADRDLHAAAAAPGPDLDAAKRAKREASEALALADRGHDRAAAHADRLIGLEAHLTERMAALEPLRDDARRIRELAMLADGTSSANRKSMRLSAYVLAARLEEIAAAASLRLAAMSSGRYTLVHSDEGARRNRQHGLDLRVVDGWTGRERHPATLSGGETFLASLALALGLADVVCAEAGGARLETLFVDEGFGALDEGALDEVLDVLDRLRDGGRSVGVVSHVPELRQRISAQLHVVKGREGSHVRATSATDPRADARAAVSPGARA
jgi:exonuclease SbcC